MKRFKYKCCLLESMKNVSCLGDSLPPDVPLETIIELMDKIFIQMTPIGEQLELPLLGQSRNNWYLIYDSYRNSQKPSRFIDFKNLRTTIEHIEEKGKDAIVMCYGEEDYAEFSSLMKKKAEAGRGITPGWGISECVVEQVDYQLHTYSRNPEHTPPIFK